VLDGPPPARANDADSALYRRLERARRRIDVDPSALALRFVQRARQLHERGLCLAGAIQREAKKQPRHVKIRPQLNCPGMHGESPLRISRCITDPAQMVVGKGVPRVGCHGTFEELPRSLQVAAP
jgi:hypothetical protein